MDEARLTPSAPVTAPELLKSVRTDPALRRSLGVTLARLGRALREFDDPLVRRPLLWDLAQLPQLRPLLAGRPENSGTSLLGEQLGRLASRWRRGWPASAPSSCTTTSAWTTR